MVQYARLGVNMDGIDKLLICAISESIKKEIDCERFSDMESRMESEFGSGFEDLVYKFDEMKMHLNGFESEMKSIENNILRDFVLVETRDSGTWLVIKNKHLTEMILRTFADEDKKKILSSMREKAETIPNVLTCCKIPNTSAYRKMSQLIGEGFVVPAGLEETFEGKRAILYRSVIDSIQIHVDKNSVVTKILVSDEAVRSSLLVRAITHMNRGSAKSLAN